MRSPVITPLLRTARSVVLLVLATAGLLSAQNAPPAVDVTRLGPQVGDRVPDFDVIDHEGRRQTLESVAGPKGTMLVFFRSADW